MLLILLACNGYPDAPPPSPSLANTMDTAHFVAHREEQGDKGGLAPPSHLKGGASLSAPLTGASPAALQVDGDLVEVSWFVNGDQVNGGTTSALDSMWFKKGDRVSARVVLSDGSSRKTVETQRLRVENSPPEFTTRRSDFRQIDGFVMGAKDADGDELSFSLQGAPAGMEIDASTGRLSYQGSQEGEAGAYTVRIVVQDPDGGKDVWPLKLDVAAGQREGVKRRYGGGE